jgi:hypothetical protein
MILEMNACLVKKSRRSQGPSATVSQKAQSSVYINFAPVHHTNVSKVLPRESKMPFLIRNCWQSDRTSGNVGALSTWACRGQNRTRKARSYSYLCDASEFRAKWV